MNTGNEQRTDRRRTPEWPCATRGCYALDLAKQIPQAAG